MLRRRTFLATAGAFGSAVATRPAFATPKAEPFAMNYAPHFGMFENSAGEDLLDQLRFAADQGFRAWEDNPMKDRDVEVQRQLANEMERLGIQMGVISALKGVWKKVNFAGNDAGRA